MNKHIKMLFLTGITKFGKVSIFSELDNLLELGIDPRVASLLGWTEQEVRGVLGEHVAALAEQLAIDVETARQILGQMYNGYRFTKSEEKV